MESYERGGTEGVAGYRPKNVYGLFMFSSTPVPPVPRYPPACQESYGRIWGVYCFISYIEYRGYGGTTKEGDSEIKGLEAVPSLGTPGIAGVP